MKYTYKGHVSGVTLKLEDKTEQEFLFHNDKDYELPEDNDYVKTLVARDHLVPVVEKKNPAKKQNEQ